LQCGAIEPPLFHRSLKALEIQGLEIQSLQLFAALPGG
jgi:hypothetical protein